MIGYVKIRVASNRQPKVTGEAVINNRFREVTISGKPDERGCRHGEALASEIEATIEFYARIFQQPSASILKRAKHFREVIHRFNPDYCREIEGIAAGAKIKEPLWIYALNARSEFLSHDNLLCASECTVLCFPDNAILGQNWDWDRHLEQNAVMMQIKLAEDHTIQMLTEPGIIGKIGMNNRGIGVCLNMLTVEKPLRGVPIHILLRAVLDARTIEEAKTAIKRAGDGRAGNIMFGDSQGRFYDVEFAGDETFWIQPEARYFIHTNHYLTRFQDPNSDYLKCSYTRFKRANKLAAELTQYNAEEMIALLSDGSDEEHPIYRDYMLDENDLNVGTVATIYMDLKAGRLSIRKGYSNCEAGSVKEGFSIPFQETN